MSASAVPAVRRVASKAARAKDEKLRSAIALYHLSPSFYPTPMKGNAAGASSSSSASSSKLLDEQIDKTIRKDLFVQPRGEQQLKVSSPPRFIGGDVMMAQLQNIASRGPSDGSSWQNSVASEIRADSSGSFLDGENSTEQSRLAQIRDAFLSSSTDAGSVPPPETRPPMEEGAPVQHHIQLQSSAAVRQGGVDERTARIRDALFGTVGAGEKPGLDAIRARKGGKTA